MIVLSFWYLFRRGSEILNSHCSYKIWNEFRILFIFSRTFSATLYRADPKILHFILLYHLVQMLHIATFPRCEKVILVYSSYKSDNVLQLTIVMPLPKIVKSFKLFKKNHKRFFSEFLPNINYVGILRSMHPFNIYTVRLENIWRKSFPVNLMFFHWPLFWYRSDTK